MRQMPEHLAFAEDHHQLIGSVDFNFDDVDEALGFIRKASPSAREEAACLVRELMTWCYRGNRPLRAAAVKLACVASGLRPDMLGDRTLGEIAAEFGISKQGMAAQSRRFSDAFGFKFARSRSTESRAKMAAARRGGPNRNIPRESHDETTTTPS
jgi:hypothetical protein